MPWAAANADARPRSRLATAVSVARGLRGNSADETRRDAAGAEDAPTRASVICGVSDGPGLRPPELPERV